VESPGDAAPRLKIPAASLHPKSPSPA